MITELFLSGIASWMVRNPQESLKNRIKTKSDMSPSDADDRITVIPEIAGEHNRFYPWSYYKDVRGIIPNLGPKGQNSYCYIQGTCMRVLGLNGKLSGNQRAYNITVRIDQERMIDLDVFVNAQHFMDGRATIKPGEAMSRSSEDSLPEEGDLIFAEVLINGIIGTGVEPTEAPSISPIIFSKHSASRPLKTTLTDFETKAKDELKKLRENEIRLECEDRWSSSSSVTVQTPIQVGSIPLRPEQNTVPPTSTAPRMLSSRALKSHTKKM